jgi:F-type H+-transporting ATPase subunit delta
MPRPSSAARRHAEAVFELAERDGTVDAWGLDLAFAAELAGDAKLTRAIDSPAVPFARRREAVEQLLGGRTAPQIVTLARLLAKRGRFGILPAVRDEYDDLVRGSRRIATATVATPMPLSAPDLAAVRTRVEELAGMKVELTTQVDPSLLGGLTVRIGDRLIDASIRGRLERLRMRLAQATPTSQAGAAGAAPEA